MSYKPSVLGQERLEFVEGNPDVNHFNCSLEMPEALH